MSLILLAACGSDDGGGAAVVDTTPWAAGVVFTTPRDAREDGLLDRRGLIHIHSYSSQDACDDMPVKHGVRDEVCFDDLRRGMCQTRHDYVWIYSKAIYVRSLTRENSLRSPRVPPCAS